MSAETAERVAQIVERALELGPAERAQFLEQACGEDADLRREAESLLGFEQRASQFIEQPACAATPPVMGECSGELKPGENLGDYQIVSLIGEGGMGEVYLADDAKLHRKVAIKLLRFGLGTASFIRRFQQEGRILAGLVHPNIARLYGSAVTANGLPYFVMEYIDGARLDDYCRERRLPTLQQLELFRKICAAVSYAHQHLVIHRDIKPANVRVTSDGEPKLLDFGIAKLLDPATSTVDATMTFAAVMTPEYASPEQLRGETISTAGDVYSLGVILYELLTGERPYRVKSRSPAEIARAITEQEPVRPSMAVARLASTNPQSAIRNPKSLRGDLDNIVLKAMRKERQRRYASVDQFSDDIARFLNGRTVTAHTDSLGYRAGKFVRRNKVAVAAACLIMLALIAGVTAFAWEARLAAAQRDEARLEQAKADRIKSFLTDMLTYSSPEYTSSNPAKNPDAKVSEIVDQAAKRAEAELGEQPEVLAEVQKTIGGVYAAQGRYEQAEAILRAAREKRIRLYGVNSHQTAEVSGKLADALLGKGNAAEADALFREDIEIERRLAAEGRGSTKNSAYALADYGAMLVQRNDPTAGACLREALKYSSAFTGKERTIVAMLYNDLGNEAYQRGDREESERYQRAALTEYQKLPPGTYVEMATTLSNLGALLIDKSKYSEAEPFVLEGLELRRRILGNAHTGTAGALYRLSDLRYRQGRHAEAEKAAQESIEMFQRALATPQDSILFTNPVLEMGMILNKVGRFHEAEAYLRQALEIRARLLPKGNPAIAKAEGALGECFTAQKRYAEAEPLLLDSYQIVESTSIESDSRRTEAAQRLTLLYGAWGKPQEAAHYRAVNVSATTK